MSTEKNEIKEQLLKEKLPNHVAIIMDGNGRWAKKQGNERIFGHQGGVGSVRAVVEAAAELGLGYLTLYAFSTENWNRPKYEVDALMGLLVSTINSETQTLIKNNVRLLAIGDLNSLPQNVREELNEAIEITSKNTGLSLNLALSYSSRWEIINAVKLMTNDLLNNKISIESIDNDLFSCYLTTANIPDPELLIRTSGECRISNFLLWQLAYTELYFTKTLWPDFNKDEFYKALLDYQNRERRFGLTSDQINKK